MNNFRQPNRIHQFLYNIRASLFPLLLLLTLPAAMQAQFNHIITNGTVTITRYTGSGGAVTIPSTLDGLPVTAVGGGAFSYLFTVSSVIIPDSVTYIGNAAFEYCSLSSVTLGTNVSYIDDFAFHTCYLTTVAIPGSVTHIGRGAFATCYNLTAITVDALNSSYTSVDGVLFDKSQNTLLQYPNGKVGAYMIPNGVTTIGTNSFLSCPGLSCVTIPGSVTSIGFQAFFYCESLTNVYCLGNAPTVDSSVFLGDTYATVYYLPGTTGWGPTFGGCPTALLSPPTIEMSPQSQTAEAGSAVEFSVHAVSPGDLAQGYLWFFNGTNNLSCTNAILHLANVQFSQSGTYTVVVTNYAGSVTGAPAVLNVISPVERRWVPALTLMGQPGSSLNLDFAAALGRVPQWTILDNVPLSTASQWYFDLTTPLPPQGFYRAWQSKPGPAPTLDVHFVPAITLTGTIGNSVRIDGINQFGPTDVWFTLDTVTFTNTSQFYFDTSSIGQPLRLWRIVPVP